jgi:hypothetical protein
MKIDEIIDYIKDILIEAEDLGFGIHVIKNYKESPNFIYHEILISKGKLFEITKIDTELFRINEFLKSLEMPFVINARLPSEGKKRLHFYEDERYIRYDGIQIRDWNLFNWVDIIILEKINI